MTTGSPDTRAIWSVQQQTVLAALAMLLMNLTTIRLTTMNG